MLKPDSSCFDCLKYLKTFKIVLELLLTVRLQNIVSLRIVTCITYCVALAVEPFAQARSDGVTIKWSTPRINTGCDGSVITRYTINYTPVGSRNDYIQVNVDPDQSVMVDIDGLVNSTEYRYFVASVDRNGRNARSVSNVFTTTDDCECLSISV